MQPSTKRDYVGNKKDRQVQKIKRGSLLENIHNLFLVYFMKFNSHGCALK